METKPHHIEFIDNIPLRIFTKEREIELPREYLKARRAAELVLIIISLPIILLPVLVISVLVAFDTRGKGIIFRQKRTGKSGRPFIMYKFRTMRSCPRGLSDYFIHPEEKVTKLGKFLRKHRLDELPQLFNVLKGDMSLIGPRPEIHELYRYFGKHIPGYFERKLVMPGCTGWAQVNLPHTVDLTGNTRKLECDLYYIKNISFILDIKILFKTFGTMIFAKGAK